MNLFKVLLAGAAVGVIVTAFRDFENESWLIPAGALGRDGEDDVETEPVLGFDGMDQETVIDWLGNADLDRATLLRMRRYEKASRMREPVLAAIEDLL